MLHSRARFRITSMKISRPVRLPLRLRSASASASFFSLSVFLSSRHLLNVCRQQRPLQRATALRWNGKCRYAMRASSEDSPAVSLSRPDDGERLTSSVMGVLASTLRRSSSISSSMGFTLAASASNSSCRTVCTSSNQQPAWRQKIKLPCKAPSHASPPRRCMSVD